MQLVALCQNVILSTVRLISGINVVVLINVELLQAIVCVYSVIIALPQLSRTLL